jgi:hypothetical protein
MSVAVFSADKTLARMLVLEAKRCGLCEAPPSEARVWLIDLDAPLPLPREDNAALHVAFTADPARVERDAYTAVLELPFSVAELDALLLRRDAPLPTFSREGESVRLAGKKIKFSKTEQALLSLLWQNRHRVVTYEELSALIGESAVNSNAAAVYLYRLRRKLEADGITRIRTVRGVGYQWTGD